MEDCLPRRWEPSVGGRGRGGWGANPAEGGQGETEAGSEEKGSVEKAAPKSKA